MLRAALASEPRRSRAVKSRFCCACFPPGQGTLRLRRTQDAARSEDIRRARARCAAISRPSRSRVFRGTTTGRPARIASRAATRCAAWSSATTSCPGCSPCARSQLRSARTCRRYGRRGHARNCRTSPTRSRRGAIPSRSRPPPDLATRRLDAAQKKSSSCCSARQPRAAEREVRLRRQERQSIRAGTSIRTASWFRAAAFTWSPTIGFAARPARLRASTGSRTCSVAPQRFTMPDDFDIEAFAAHSVSGIMHGDNDTTVTVRFSPLVARGRQGRTHRHAIAPSRMARTARSRSATRVAIRSSSCAGRSSGAPEAEILGPVRRSRTGQGARPTISRSYSK